MHRQTRRCLNCGKVVPALSTYLRFKQIHKDLHGICPTDDDVVFCTVSCFLEYNQVEIIDPKMENVSV